MAWNTQLTTTADFAGLISISCELFTFHHPIGVSTSETFLPLREAPGAEMGTFHITKF